MPFSRAHTFKMVAGLISPAAPHRCGRVPSWAGAATIPPATQVAQQKLPWRKGGLPSSKSACQFCAYNPGEKMLHFFFFPSKFQQTLVRAGLLILTVSCCNPSQCSAGASLWPFRVLLRVRTANSSYEHCQLKFNLLAWSVRQICVSGRAKYQPSAKQILIMFGNQID